MILCIDPGESTGYCVLNNDGTIYDFGRGVDAVALQFLGVDTLVVEIPKIRPGGPQESIVTLALTAGRLVQDIRRRCSVRKAYGVFPERWKGQVPKKQHNARVLSKLGPLDHARFQNHAQNWAKDDDVIDAIGIALWVKDRMNMLDKVADYTFHPVGWAA